MCNDISTICENPSHFIFCQIAAPPQIPLISVSELSSIACGYYVRISSSFSQISTDLTTWACEISYIDGPVQERRNSIAIALELHLSCTNPSACLLSTLVLFSVSQSTESGCCSWEVIILSQFKIFSAEALFLQRTITSMSFMNAQWRQDNSRRIWCNVHYLIKCSFGGRVF